jgi:uncharacterized protein involved in exopolysaccharide biosynthesis
LKENKAAGSGGIDILDLLIIPLKRKRMIAAITLGVAVAAVVVSFLLPPVFRAETRILPPRQGSSGMASQLMDQLGGVAGILGGALPVKNPNELYVEMLRSRTVLDRIVDRFGLMKTYDVKYREEARKRLLRAFRAQEEKKSGIVLVTIEDRDPIKAADMANAFVEELKALSSGLAVTEAAQRRLFFEEQLKDTKAALGRSEDAVRGFMEKTGALQIDSQTKAVIEGMAHLKAQVAAKEVQLKVLRTFATPQNPDLQKVEEEMRGLKNEVAKLESRGEGGYNPLMPTGRMPSVGTEYLRKLRDLKYNETLFELLAKQYEIAKLDEARDAAVIQVIDRAVPPERKFRPNRKLILLLSAFVAFFLSILLACVLEYVERSAADPANRGKYDLVRKYMRIRET